MKMTNWSITSWLWTHSTKMLLRSECFSYNILTAVIFVAASTNLSCCSPARWVRFVCLKFNIYYDLVHVDTNQQHKENRKPYNNIFQQIGQNKYSFCQCVPPFFDNFKVLISNTCNRPLSWINLGLTVLVHFNKLMMKTTYLGFW